MQLPRSHHCSLTRQIGNRRVVAGGLLIGYVLLLAGIPLPLPVAPSDQPYPCQGCRCQSAAQCWHGCCCLSDAQKRAWAEKYGIAPPKFMMANAERKPPATRSCCSKNDRRGDDAIHRESTCTVLATTLDGERNERHSGQPRRMQTRFVTGIQTLKCRGVGANWLTLGDFLSWTTPSSWTPEESPTAAIVVPARGAADVFLPPPSPPPRGRVV